MSAGDREDLSVEQARAVQNLAELNRQVKDALYDRGRTAIQAQAMKWLSGLNLRRREWQFVSEIYRWTFAGGKNWKPLATVSRQQFFDVLGLKPGARSVNRLKETSGLLIERGIVHRIRSGGRTAAIWRLGIVDLLLASKDGNGIAADDDAAAAVLDALSQCEQTAEARYRERTQPVTTSKHGSAERQPVTAFEGPTRNHKAPPTRNQPWPLIANGVSEEVYVSPSAAADARKEKPTAHDPAQANELGRLNLALPEDRRWRSERLLVRLHVVGFDATRTELLKEEP